MYSRKLDVFHYRRNECVLSVAYSVGFTNYSNFYRLYKKYMGITPLEFKQQMATATRKDI